MPCRVLNLSNQPVEALKLSWSAGESPFVAAKRNVSLSPEVKRAWNWCLSPILIQPLVICKLQRLSLQLFTCLEVVGEFHDLALVLILEFNWNQHLGHKRTKLNICHHMLTSSTQLQNRSFHVVEERERLQNVERWKMHVQSVQKYWFSLSNMQICGVFVAVIVVVAKLPKTAGYNKTLFWYHAVCVFNVDWLVSYTLSDWISHEKALTRLSSN